MHENKKHYLLTTDEAECLACFRTLPPDEQGIIMSLVASLWSSHPNTERQNIDTPVKLLLIK